MKRFVLFVLLTGVTDVVIAQSDKLACKDFNKVDVLEVSIEELMDVPVATSASQQAACTKEAANIVSLISHEEILNRGARDLMDVLQLIPGITPSMNIAGVVGIGIRGMSADDGKMAVFIDGIMLTEQIYAQNAIGGHFPVEQIDHVEIIRGSSSILNGNFTEIGMINIITKNAKKAEGLAVTTNYGHFERGEARKNISMAAGKIFDDLEISFSGKANESQRSDRIYHDAHDGSFDMANNSQIDSLYGNLNFKYKELNLRLLSDEYQVEQRDGMGDYMEPEGNYNTVGFTTYAAKLDFEHPFNNHFKINSNFDFSRQMPWKTTLNFSDGSPSQLASHEQSDHYKLNTKATWMADSGSYLAVGASYQKDDYIDLLMKKESALSLKDYTAYIESVYKTEWADILLGGRFDYYTNFGTNFAPRVALTKQLDKFHYKLLYTHAFHAPTVGNYRLNVNYNSLSTSTRDAPSLVPEITYNYEIELGYTFSTDLEIVSNIFYTDIQNIFTYQQDKYFENYFINADKFGTYGLETEIKYKNSMLGRFDFGYSFYQSAKNTLPMVYQATDAQGNVLYPNMHLGFPTHKVTLNHVFNFTTDFSFNHNLVFYSDRFNYSGSQLTHNKPDWIYNIYLRYKNMPIKGAEVGLGLYDVFNERYQYVQQANGSHPGLPAASRELMLRLSYQF